MKIYKVVLFYKIEFKISYGFDIIVVYDVKQNNTKPTSMFLTYKYIHNRKVKVPF